MPRLEKNDLPEWFGPMLVKEIRQSMRRGSFVWPFLGLHMLVLAAMIMELRGGGNSGSGSSQYAGVLNPWVFYNSGVFWIIVAGICSIVIPLGGLILMGQETEDENYQLLLLTELNRWNVVCGKFWILWGLSWVSFISMLPYLLVRYIAGGIEWWHEAARAGTVLGVAALVSAGAIGASVFRNLWMRCFVFGSFLGAAAIGAGVPMAASAGMTKGCGILYHCTALAAWISYVLAGLAIARAKIRLPAYVYQANPSGWLLGMILVSPFAIAIVTAFTIGYGGIAGLLIFCFLILYVE